MTNQRRLHHSCVWGENRMNWTKEKLDELATALKNLNDQNIGWLAIVCTNSFEAEGDTYRDLSLQREAATDLPKLIAALEAVDIKVRETMEVYIGSEGFHPKTAPEAYLQQEFKRMYDAATEALQAIKEVRGE